MKKFLLCASVVVVVAAVLLVSGCGGSYNAKAYIRTAMNEYLAAVVQGDVKSACEHTTWGNHFVTSYHPGRRAACARTIRHLWANLHPQDFFVGSIVKTPVGNYSVHYALMSKYEWLPGIIAVESTGVGYLVGREFNFHDLLLNT